MGEGLGAVTLKLSRLVGDRELTPENLKTRMNAEVLPALRELVKKANAHVIYLNATASQDMEPLEGRIALVDIGPGVSLGLPQVHHLGDEVITIDSDGFWRINISDGTNWREFSTEVGMLRPSTNPNTDALMTVDGLVTWASRAPRPLDTTYAPVALYQFSNGAPNGLLDVSGVANAHLTVSAGTERYGWMHPYMQGLLLDGATEMIHNAFNAAVALTGDMSAIWIGTILSFPGATQPTLFGHGAAGELAAANILYGLFQNNAATTDGRLLTYLHEQGAGVDEPHAFGTAWTFPNVITLFGFSRSGNVIRGYAQGYPWAAASGVLNAPTDGGNGRLRVGGFAGGSFFSGMCGSLALYNRVLTPDEFLERYNYTLGPAFGRKG